MATTSTGLSGDNTITGTSGSDKLIGGSGNDTIDGGAGSDFISAGGGNDTIIYDEYDYKILGGGGIDTLWFYKGGQQLKLGQQAVGGIERLLLDGGGYNQVWLSASDIVRVSELDQMVIIGQGNNAVWLTDSGWKFDGLTADKQSQILSNGLAKMVVSLPIYVDGFSNNARIIVEGNQLLKESLTSSTLVSQGTITVTDPNPGQGLLRDGDITYQSALGSLKISLRNGWSSTGPAVYDFTYSVSNAKVQHLNEGEPIGDSFLLWTIDGFSDFVNFTIVGTNNPASIGNLDPDKSYVTEDVGVDATGKLNVSGKLQISDVDDPAVFNINVISTVGNLGTLELAYDGTYTYSVANTQVQYLASGGTKVDTFTVIAFDGTTKEIAFTINRFPGEIRGTPDDDNPLNGTAGGEIIRSLAGNDTIFAGNGNDFIDGGAGNDNMYGGNGDDTYVVDSDLDAVIEFWGEGIDTVWSYMSFTMPDHIENLELLGNASINATGNELANFITAHDGNNIIFGLGGNDYIKDLTGNALIHGGDGDDTIERGPGGYGPVYGDAGDDTFIFYSTAKNQGIYGGSGSDIFHLASDIAPASSTTRIHDFTLNTPGVTGDTLELPGSESLYLLRASSIFNGSTELARSDGSTLLTLLGINFSSDLMATMISQGNITFFDMN